MRRDLGGSEHSGGPRVALLVARREDQEELGRVPVLKRTRTRVLRDAKTLENLLESGGVDACVVDAELALVSPLLWSRLTAHLPTLVILGEQQRALVVTGARVDFAWRPLEWIELELRISRLVEQSPVGQPARLRCGSLEVDPETDNVMVPGGTVKLRRLELKVLVYLLRNPSRWIAVEELQRQVLGTSGGGGSVRTHIWEIRNKLARCGARDLIQSEHGKGYRAVAP